MIVDDMPIEDYHADDSLSKSGLTQILRSVDHFHHYRESFKRTRSLDLGTAIHELVLMGREAYTALVAVRPDDDRGNFRKTAGKEWKAEQEAAGLTILTRADAAKVEAASRAVLEHPIAGPLLAECYKERSHFWTDLDTGLRCRCRPDALTEDGGVLVDLKTAKDAAYAPFRRAVANYRYDMQWAHYGNGIEQTTGLEVQAFVIIAVEPEPPYGVAIYHLADEWRERGELAARAALERYANWKDSQDTDDRAPAGYPTQIQTMEIPKWAI